MSMFEVEGPGGRSFYVQGAAKVLMGVAVSGVVLNNLVFEDDAGDFVAAVSSGFWVAVKRLTAEEAEAVAKIL